MQAMPRQAPPDTTPRDRMECAGRVVKFEAGGSSHLVLAIVDVCALMFTIAWELAEELHLQIARYTHERGCMLRLRGKHGVTPSLIQTGTLPHTFAPLVAQSTVFGWVLSGSCRT